MKKTDFLIISFIILSSIYTLKDLFKPGFYTSHDGIHQVVRLFYFDQLLADGQIPPRYVGDLYNGFGYPLFSFSYQLPWFIAEPMHLLGLSIFDSIKMTFLIGFILSGITMYFFQKNVFGRLAAFVGMIVYLFAPYRFLNIFVRAAVGDATSFVFLPLIFLSIYKIRLVDKTPRKWIALGSISLAGLLLSHAMVFILTLIIILSYIFYWLLFIQKRKQFIIFSSLVLIIGLGITSYYFIPSLIERNFTNFNEIMRVIPLGFTYLKIKDLIYSSWGFGTLDAPEGRMSFQIGIAQWISVIVGFILLIKFYKSSRKLKLQEQPILKEAIFYLTVFLFSIFLTLPNSSFLWSVINKVAYVDLPWRVMVLTVFAASWIAGFVINKIKYKMSLAFFIIILALYANRNHIHINQVLDWPVDFYLKLETTTNSFDEYVPKWAPRHLMKNKITRKVQFTDDKADIIVLQNQSNYLQAKVDAYEHGLVKINTVYYPGWQVYVDGKKVKFNYESSGFMEVPLEKGKYTVEAKFGETPFRLISDLLTISSIGFLGIMIKKKKINE